MQDRFSPTQEKLQRCKPYTAIRNDEVQELPYQQKQHSQPARGRRERHPIGQNRPEMNDPFSRSMCTMARPIPLAPPVTKATLRVSESSSQKLYDLVADARPSGPKETLLPSGGQQNFCPADDQVLGPQRQHHGTEAYNLEAFAGSWYSMRASLRMLDCISPIHCH